MYVPAHVGSWSHTTAKHLTVSRTPQQLSLATLPQSWLQGRDRPALLLAQLVTALQTSVSKIIEWPTSPQSLQKMCKGFTCHK